MSNELITNDKQAMNALKKHGGNIVWAIIAVLALYFGWQFYQKNYAKVDTVAADSYTAIMQKSEQLILANQDPNTKVEASAKQDLFVQIDELVKAHGDTVYAWQALMAKARLQADDEDYKGSAKTLEQASTIAIDDLGLIAISRLELASVLLADNQLDEALAIVQGQFPEAFEPSRLEVEGDILVAKKDNEGAKTSYQKAWDILTQRNEDRALLGLKLQSLGITPEAIAPKYAVVATDPAPNP